MNAEQVRIEVNGFVVPWFSIHKDGQTYVIECDLPYEISSLIDEYKRAIEKLEENLEDAIDKLED